MRVCIRLYKTQGSVELIIRAQELCESRGGHPGLPAPSSPYSRCGRKATLNLELSQSSGAAWKSRWPSSNPRLHQGPNGLCGLKQPLEKKKNGTAQKLCESRSGRPEFPVRNIPYGLCGRKATQFEEEEWGSSQL